MDASGWPFITDTRSWELLTTAEKLEVLSQFGSPFLAQRLGWRYWKDCRGNWHTQGIGGVDWTRFLDHRSQ